MTDFYSITIENNSNIVGDDEVYILSKGQNPKSYSGEAKYKGQTYNFDLIESYLL